MKQLHIPQPRETDRARTLRKQTTVPERLLWGMLSNRRLEGYKFRRQAPISGYVLDFYCHEARLAIELDGLTHEGTAAKDEVRTEHLRLAGVEVIRFTNDDVVDDVTLVAEAILREVRTRISGVPSPQPSPRGRGRR